MTKKRTQQGMLKRIYQMALQNTLIRNIAKNGSFNILLHVQDHSNGGIQCNIISALDQSGNDYDEAQRAQLSHLIASDANHHDMFERLIFQAEITEPEQHIDTIYVFLKGKKVPGNFNGLHLHVNVYINDMSNTRIRRRRNQIIKNIS
jgi:hypothetical protein